MVLINSTTIVKNSYYNDQMHKKSHVNQHKNAMYWRCGIKLTANRIKVHDWIYASRQKSRLKTARVLPRPRRFDASPRGYCMSLLPCLKASERQSFVIIIYNFHPLFLFKSVFQLHEAEAIMVVIQINIVVSCHTILRIQVIIIYMVF